MPASILTTKLYIPPPRPVLINRARLLTRMDHAQHGKLTLISAPAGFGKTTVAASWVAASDRPAAWLSLSPEESDPVRFLSYCLAALQSVAPGLGEDIAHALRSPQPPSTDALLTALLNELAAVSSPLVLILDDYHVIEAKAVDDALTFLLDHLPPQMHLVVITREDPQLPLARLRGRGELNEIRAADLRFTVDEAADFLKASMGRDLPANVVAALEARTEGWIAGLQLAALSMVKRDDIPGFVEAFAGDHRYIMDYLVDEVLAQQTQSVHSFLLHTSILTELTGPLCDAVTGRSDGHAMLTGLERSNLFVTPLDDRRRWFRYHHLFADVLRAHLQTEEPELVPALHRRAAAWYAAHDQPGDAIRHALAAEEVNEAAALLEQNWPPMDRNRQTAVWLKWARVLPEEVVRKRPVLTAALGWAHLDRGELEDAEARLQQVEQWLEQTNAGTDSHGVTKDVIVDEAQFGVLRASVASARTYLAQARGDRAGALRHARRALALLPPDEHLRRGVPASLLSLAAWTEGDLTAAVTLMVDAMESFHKAGNVLYAVTGAYVLADLRVAQGRLHAAMDTCRRALELAEEQGKFAHLGTADIYTQMADINREWNDLHAAAQALERSRELGEQATLPRWRYRWCLAQARLQQAYGDFERASALVQEAEGHYVRGPVPDVQPIAAWQAHIRIRRGDTAGVRAWAQAQSLTVEDELTYVREFEYITLVRLLLAEPDRAGNGRAREHALALLDRLRRRAEEGERMGSLLTILVLQALALKAQGKTDAARSCMARVLDLAAPEGYVRLFVDEGSTMKELLLDAVAHGGASAYTDTLMTAFGQDKLAQGTAHAQHPATALPREQPLIEPLSARELEVLHLIAQGLSNRAISERLFLALSTVKGHNRNIYGKLQVQRRTEAVARARELGLLD